MPKYQQFACPECNGKVSSAINGINFDSDDDCWYCDGTGYATDEATEEEIIRWEK